jgi:lipoprotein-releasing system permease protein
MLPLSLAVRFLRTGRGQTVLIVTGVAIAVAAQIFIGLLIGSLQKTLVDRTVGNQPHITIVSSSDSAEIPASQNIAAALKNGGLVKDVAVSASGNGFLLFATKDAPVLVRGVDSAAEAIYHIRTAVYEGTWDSSQGALLIGKDLREQLALAVGDTVIIRTSGGQSSSLPISGFFDLGVAQIDKSWVFTSLPTAQSLFGYGTGVTSIECTVADPFQADSVAAGLRPILAGGGVSISDWKSQNEQLLSGLQGQTISSLMIQIFIVVSVVIAISAILAITVFQKSRQLGILKAMGIKDGAASLIFIYEALIIGLIGSVAGIALGLSLLYGFSAGTAHSGATPLIDIYIDYKFIFISWAVAVLAAVVAALIPARRTLRLDPMEVIREG